MGLGGQRQAPAALPPGKKHSNQRTGVWVDPKAVWKVTGNQAPTGIRFPDRPGRNESLYGLRYLRENFTFTFTYRYSGFPYWFHSINIHRSATSAT